MNLWITPRSLFCPKYAIDFLQNRHVFKKKVNLLQLEVPLPNSLAWSKYCNFFHCSGNLKQNCFLANLFSGWSIYNLWENSALLNYIEWVNLLISMLQGYETFGLAVPKFHTQGHFFVNPYLKRYSSPSITYLSSVIIIFFTFFSNLYQLSST